MSWIPLGPSFVFSPINAAYRRLSGQNEWNRQASVYDLAIAPTNPLVMYALTAPQYGGTSLFRSNTGGNSWTSIPDPSEDPRTDIHCVTVDPSDPDILYVGTYNTREIWRLTASDGRWMRVASMLPGGVIRVLMDPRYAGTPSTSHLYVATEGGLLFSSDGGSSFAAPLVNGNVQSFCAHFPSLRGEPAEMYASAVDDGIYYGNGGNQSWTNLSSLDIGLPVRHPYYFNIDLCPGIPRRVYAARRNPNDIDALFTSTDPLRSWSAVTMSATAPGWSFAVAPHSPGNGANDVLFFGGVGFARSSDGGRTIEAIDGSWLHHDRHCFRFVPEEPSAGIVPRVFVGSDGGLCMSEHAADGRIPFAQCADVARLNDGAIVDSRSPTFFNLNHGLESVSHMAYGGDAGISAIGYIGVLDTGIARRVGGLTWRAMRNADVVGMAATRSRDGDGIKIWGMYGAFGDFPFLRIVLWTDRGGEYESSFGRSERTPTFDGQALAANSPLRVGVEGNLIVGALWREPREFAQIILTPVTLPTGAASGVFTVEVSRIDGVVPNAVLQVGDPSVHIIVTSVTANSFTATFYGNVAAGTRFWVQNVGVVQIDGNATPRRIGQLLNRNGRDVAVIAVAIDPTNANKLYCATNDGTVWKCINATRLESALWTSIGTAPTGNNITALACDPRGAAYALLERSWRVSPLVWLDGDLWRERAPVAGTLPPDGFAFGPMVADPLDSSRLFVAYGAKVFALQWESQDQAWRWEDISRGLPTQWVSDLWIGDVAQRGHRVVLRAFISTRGAWEYDLGQQVDSAEPYLRHHFLDEGRFPITPDGLANPFIAGERVWHFQSPDIKLDAQQLEAGATFFQANPPLESGEFDLLRDNSQALPAGDRAWVHIKVHNRSLLEANGLKVWVLYCDAALRLFALDETMSGASFDFWSLFDHNGSIHYDRLPADSAWKPIGEPADVPSVTAASPQIVSFDWTAPTPSVTNPSGHYCLLAFVHSAARPLVETDVDVDRIVPRNRQLAQKNLHVGPMLRSDGSVPDDPNRPAVEHVVEYIAYHNPFPKERTFDLLIDTRHLPASLSLRFALSNPDFILDYTKAVHGAKLLPEANEKKNLLWEVRTGAQVRIKGLRLAGHASDSLVLEIAVRDKLVPGSEYQLTVLQRDHFQQSYGKRTRRVGGITLILRTEGEEKLILPENRDEELPPNVRREDFAPPWSKEVALLRRERIKKVGH